MPDKPFCPFCSDQIIIAENELAYATYDTYPASPGHCLVIPRRHVASYFDASDEEKAAIWALVEEAKPIIDKDHNPGAYNIGINIGATAGQSVPHIHVHIIPRYVGDVDNPKGGVRGVIPHKQKYTKKVS